jgi:Family of unknown function (DUF6325)
MATALGPVEVLVIGFPGSQFNGRILPEIQALIDKGTINVVDAVLIHKGPDGELDMVDFEQPGLDEAAVGFRALLGEAVYEFVSAEDVEEFARALEPGSSAAVLVVEHAWAKPFADAVVNSGGFMVHNLRIPAAVIDELLGSLSV